MNFMLMFILTGCQEDVLNYTLWFDTGGGSIVTPITFEEGETVILPDPIKDGYLFDGWFMDAALSQSFSFDDFYEHNYTDITLYAKWITADSELTTLLKQIYQLASVSNAFEGTYEDWLETVRGPQGLPGIDGKTPYIGDNGNWFIDQNDTGVFAGYNDSSITQSGEFRFAVNSDGKSYYLLSYTGFDRYIMIPESFNGYPVTAIGSSVFEDNIIVEHVVIPVEVIEIEDSAFAGASNLETVTIEKESQLTIIGDSAFAGASALTSIYIPSGVTSIGEFAFTNASALSTVTIEEGSQLTLIKDFAFYGVSTLTSIYIPSTVTSIGDSAFQNAIALETVTIEEGSQLESIGDNAFYDTFSLKSIFIPANVTIIKKSTFFRNIALKTVTFEEGSKLTDIDSYAFHSANSLTDFEIPEGVTKIGFNSLSGATSLQSIHIPASVTLIEEYAFTGTQALSTVTFGEGSLLTEIGRHAFFASGITSIVIPANVLYIQNYAFGSALSLESVQFEEGSQLRYIMGHAFYGANKIESIEIPPSVTTIREYAFAQMTNLESVYIPIGVTMIGEHAFFMDTSLIIFAAATSKPAGWNTNWNSSNQPVAWGQL